MRPVIIVFNCQCLEKSMLNKNKIIYYSFITCSLAGESESQSTMKFATTFVTVLAVVLGLSKASAAYKFCPIYWQLFDGQCYRYFGDRVTFATAQTSCHDYYTNSGRAELASIHSNDVNSFLYDLFRSSAGDLPDGVRISFISFHLIYF